MPDKSQFRVVEVFQRLVDNQKNAEIVTSFTNRKSPLKIVIATVAFGMGIDCDDVRTVLHYGAPEDVDT